MKIACFIYADDPKYDFLKKNAIASFKKWHPDITIFATDKRPDIENFQNINGGVLKLMWASKIATENKIDKIIILGADTITCSVLDEFLQDDKTEVLTTLDYPYRLITRRRVVCSNNQQDHVNADVICFNGTDPINKIIDLWAKYKTEYAEQAAINLACNIFNIVSSRIVDGDYQNSDVVYNCRSKGNLSAKAGETDVYYKYTNLFYVNDKKLYTGLHENCSVKPKHIKVWHYCAGFGTMNEEKMNQSLLNWKNLGFNQQTKEFFTNQCNCEGFN